jgi:uncharacterized protein (DUF433 family)
MKPRESAQRDRITAGPGDGLGRTAPMSVLRRPRASRVLDFGSMVFDRITTDSARLGGQPCIRDLRITVRRVLEALRTYPDRAAIFREYPELEEEDLKQALAYAEALVDDKIVELPHAG